MAHKACDLYYTPQEKGFGSNKLLTDKVAIPRTIPAANTRGMTSGSVESKGFKPPGTALGCEAILA